MNTILFKEPGINSLETKSKEEDLKPMSGLSDDNCDWCGRHLSELKPFDLPGDRFEDVFVFRLWRPEIHPDEENAKIREEFFGDCSDKQEAWKRLINRYGEEEARQISMIEQLSSTWGNGYLCANCIISYFGEDYLRQIKQYFLKMDRVYSENLL